MVKYYFFTSSYGEEICKSKRGYNLRDFPETRKKPSLQDSYGIKNRYRDEMLPSKWQVFLACLKESIPKHSVPAFYLYSVVSSGISKVLLPDQ